MTICRTFKFYFDTDNINSDHEFTDKQLVQIAKALSVDELFEISHAIEEVTEIEEG